MKNILLDGESRIVIAIDGEAGSGKGSFSKKFASKYNLKYFQSSIYYRKFAYLSLISSQSNIDILSQKNFIDLLENIDNRIIYSDEVSQRASIIAEDKNVRNALLYPQRRIIEENKRIIVEGRDIGTVIAPDSDVKLYFKADITERARRRYNQYKEIGQDIDLESVTNSIIERDKRDMERQESPLSIALDAIVVDSSNMNEADFFAYVEKIIIENCNIEGE